MPYILHLELLSRTFGCFRRRIHWIVYFEILLIFASITSSEKEYVFYDSFHATKLLKQKLYFSAHFSGIKLFDTLSAAAAISEGVIYSSLESITRWDFKTLHRCTSRRFDEWTSVVGYEKTTETVTKCFDKQKAPVFFSSTSFAISSLFLFTFPQ